MRVVGVDFTSSPGPRKPITAARCILDGNKLTLSESIAWGSFTDFEQELQRPGLWIAGLDFPFGQSRKFIENIGWPQDWAGYVAHAQTLGRQGFRDALELYKAPRPAGDREHRRRADAITGAISPQKLYGVPVALMFFEGAHRVIASGATVPYLKPGDPDRVVVEAYPGVLARFLVDRASYKNDSKAKQTPALYETRLKMLQELASDRFQERYGILVEPPLELANDPTGDSLDALLCAIQAAGAWIHREKLFNAPPTYDPLEGWIADPIAQGWR